MNVRSTQLHRISQPLRFESDQTPLHSQPLRALRAILPKYLNDEPIVGQNVVLWYVLHLHHLPRTEDWPGMRIEWASFTLRPRDFLDASTVQAR